MWDLVLVRKWNGRIAEIVVDNVVVRMMIGLGWYENIRVKIR